MKANLVDLSDLVMLNPTTTSSRFSQQHLLVSHDVIFSFVVDFPIPLLNGPYFLQDPLGGIAIQFYIVPGQVAPGKNSSRVSLDPFERISKYFSL